MKSTVAMVLGGGRGTRLFPLTAIRSKPAVPLGGMYRLIDIPISNCINSGINQIYVLTQFMSVSLHRHIRRTYNFDHFSGGFVEILAAQETMNSGTDWYQGTADAVRKNLGYINQRGVDYVVILSGDQLYRMDYGDLIRRHQETNADVTIACMPVTEQAASAFGVMRLDTTGRVLGFLEKPQTSQELDIVRVDPQTLSALGVHDPQRNVLASMGIYVFNRDLLQRVLTKTNYQDFGKEVFPAAIRTHNVQTFLFDGYWEDIGTIRSFYEANLNLASDRPPFPLVSPESPVYSRARFLPPSRFGNATVRGSLVAGGCLIGDGAVIENSVIGLRTIVGPGATIRNSVVMGADYYDAEELSSGEAHAVTANPSKVPLGIGAGSVIEGSIVDKNVRIAEGVRIVNTTGRQDSTQDHAWCVIRDGIPVIVKNSEIPSGWNLEL
ncbi:MAG TPA: glucose-1-phosphate adenylyltransferase [Pirellulaceae bacterium]|nr:glucose-1-phosphate adenylyltransferase [Pirellulaceae bacterium]